MLVDTAQAARPFVVDDARVVDPGACQVESWVKRNPDNHELWALPACNVRGLELTAGGGVATAGAPGTTAERDYQFQAKTLLRELEPGRWGVAASAGVVRHADINVRQNLIANYYATVLPSYAFANERFVLLTSAGVLDSREDRRRGLSWGVGGEWYLTPKVIALAEVYGATGFDRFAQAGVRWWLVPDRVQIDSTYGWQLNGPIRTEWVTIGVRLISPTFF